MESGEVPVVERGQDALPSLPLTLTAPAAGEPRQIQAERLLGADFALAAMVLRVANGPLYARGRRITSIDAALRVLGVGTVRR
ncbi:MAG: HDOD domain-containing protein, partial [Planctomycetota bacterium]